MKTNNRSHQSFDATCEFADQLVAVLYDEAIGREKLEFERHAAHCQTCRAELATFGSVKNELGEYREMVLQTLDAPEIVLPQIAEIGRAEKRDWTIRLREFLFPAGNLRQTATAFAAFLVCATLVSVFAVGVFQSNGEPQVARNQANDQTPIEKSSGDKSAIEAARVIAPLTQQSPEIIKPATPSRANSTSPETKSKSSTRNPRARAKTVSHETKTRKTKSESARRRVDLELTAEDDAPEDDAPRLSDLLEEIDSVS